MSSHDTRPLPEIDEVLQLLNRIPAAAEPARSTDASLGEAIEQCLALIDRDIAPSPEPIRIIHHLSCTGGTLFAKCIASMPNVLLLNEVDPLSPLPFRGGKPPFTPTDMVALLRQGDPHISPDFIIRLFQQQIGFLRDELANTGRVLVLRDHSHSHFLTGDRIPDRPTLREILMETFEVRSVLTVRDPVDSYLSMQKQGWHKHFSPSGFDEYCRRYHAFLAKYEGVDIVRYEDLVAQTKPTMLRICQALQIKFTHHFTELFCAIRLSGDSGRSGDVIEPRSPRKTNEELARFAKMGGCTLSELFSAMRCER